LQVDFYERTEVSLLGLAKLLPAEPARVLTVIDLIVRPSKHASYASTVWVKSPKFSVYVCKFDIFRI
jgi:hypothetical protein